MADPTPTVAATLPNGTSNVTTTAASTTPPQFANKSQTGEIPSYNGDTTAKATDFANYFCSYAQLYHQKQMLADHNRMAAYHSAILGNSEVFKDKVVMDVGTGSGILSVWAAQAGARKVYAVEYTDMAKHAKRVMQANGVDHIVTVMQGAVEDIELPIEADGLNPEGPIDIMISEWMGYFLLRESMMDSLIRARDKFLNPKTGLMFPSHCSMFVAPIVDEQERKQNHNEYAAAMADWQEFAETTRNIYGVEMNCLEQDFEKEQKEYYLLSSRWCELPPDAVVGEPKMIKHYDMATCTLEEARGIAATDKDASFCFDISGDEHAGPISAIAGWFTSDFRSRTDTQQVNAPPIENPSFLSTGPENGYTHWGQQVFYLVSPIPLLKGEITRLEGRIEMMRTAENARLYNCRFQFQNSRRKVDAPDDKVLMKSPISEHVYQIP